jgi:hypothetical protein
MAQVNGYQPNLPIDPSFIVANLPTTAFDTKFKNAGGKPQYELEEEVLHEIKIIDSNERRSVRSLAGALGISSSSIGSMKKEKKKELRVYTTHVLEAKVKRRSLFESSLSLHFRD